MINELFSAVLQVLVFALIPFIVYLIRQKSNKGFLHYIGLKKTNKKAILGSFLVSILLFLPIFLMVLFNDDFKSIMHHPESMTGKFRAMGGSLNTYLIILVIAIVKTAFAEEILFRGFVAKRLIAITTYKTGNLIHAFIFGIMHSLLFMSISSNPLFLVVIFIFPSIGAYLMVHFNEKVGGGSIFPGWVAHATANVLSYTIIGLVI